jgi:hypothetical protein
MGRTMLGEPLGHTATTGMLITLLGVYLVLKKA